MILLFSMALMVSCGDSEKENLSVEFDELMTENDSIESALAEFQSIHERMKQSHQELAQQLETMQVSDSSYFEQMAQNEVLIKKHEGLLAGHKEMMQGHQELKNNFGNLSSTEMKAQISEMKEVHGTIMNDHSTIKEEHDKMQSTHNEIRKNLIDSNPENQPAG